MFFCYVGTPIELRATYAWTLYHSRTMLHFSWVGAPSATIGQGFSVEPKIMNIDPATGAKVPVYKSATLPCDLHLIVRGPGLPASGKEIALDWAQAPCLSTAASAYCRQFLNLATLSTFDQGIHYTVSFVSGYSSQELGKAKGNLATWRVCVDGPYSHATVVNLAKYSAHTFPWELTNIWAIQALTAALDDPAALGETSLDPSIAEIDHTIRELQSAVSSPREVTLLQPCIDALGEIRQALGEVDRLLTAALRARSNDRRRELLNQAIGLLTGTTPAHEQAQQSFRAYETHVRTGQVADSSRATPDQ